MAGATLDAQSFGSTVGDQGFAVTVGGPNHNITTVRLRRSDQPARLRPGQEKPTGGGGYVVQFTQATPKTTTSKAPSDFDGVGHTRLAYYWPSTQQWRPARAPA